MHDVLVQSYWCSRTGGAGDTPKAVWGVARAARARVVGSGAIDVSMAELLVRVRVQAYWRSRAGADVMLHAVVLVQATLPRWSRVGPRSHPSTSSGRVVSHRCVHARQFVFGCSRTGAVVLVQSYWCRREQKNCCAGCFASQSAPPSALVHAVVWSRRLMCSPRRG